mgnify:CR=1 FL=1
MIVLAVLLGGSYYLWGNTDDSASATEKTYTNTTYDYSFMYPAQYTVREGTKERVNIGTSTQAVFLSSAEAFVVQGTSTSATTTFDTFMLGMSRQLCTSTATLQQASCTAVATNRAFTSDNDAEGRELMLTLTTRVGTGATATSTFGPVYVFNIGTDATSTGTSTSASARHTALFLYRPIGTYFGTSTVTSTMNDLVRSIAETLELDK